MQIGESFSFMFQDSDWLKKILIGALLSLIPFVGAFLLYGYYREVFLSASAKKAIPLPEWVDFSDKLLHGFKIFVSFLIYGLPVFVLYIFVPVAVALFATSSDKTASTLIAVLSGIGIFLLLLYFLYFLLVAPAIFITYFKTGLIKDAINPKLHWRYIRQAGSCYWIAYIMSQVAFLLSGFGVIICFIGVYATAVWAGLVSAHLFAQCEEKVASVNNL